MGLINVVKILYNGMISPSIGPNQLQWSFSPVYELKRWKSYLDPNNPLFSYKTIIHYTILMVVILFSFVIMPVPILLKVVMLLGILYLLAAPIFSQFFRPALPVLSWVILFFNSKNIPLAMRQPITVTVLPRLEDFFFADNLSELLATNTNNFKDIFAWLPYGIIHFSFPFVVAALIFLFGPPTALNGFGFTFGYMNLTGVIVQNLLFSCAPPWYKVLHGLGKANYQMDGSPGGLARIDKILGIDLYTTTFTNSPLIFGAMPSLHSGCSTMDAIWLCYLWPKLTPVWAAYVMWLWYSTMYLTHHYFIDVVVGSNLAFFWFLVYKNMGKLPINNKFCRWDFREVEYHNVKQENDNFKALITGGQQQQSFNIDEDLELQNLHVTANNDHSAETNGSANRNTKSVPRKPSKQRDSVDVVLDANATTVNDNSHH